MFSPPHSPKAIGVLEEAKQLRRAERSFILRSRVETSELGYATLIHFSSQYIPKTASWSRLPLKKMLIADTSSRGLTSRRGPRLRSVPLNLGKLCSRQPGGSERWPAAGPQMVAARRQSRFTAAGRGDITQTLSPPCLQKKSICSPCAELENSSS